MLSEETLESPEANSPHTHTPAGTHLRARASRCPGKKGPFQTRRRLQGQVPPTGAERETPGTGASWGSEWGQPAPCSCARLGGGSWRGLRQSSWARVTRNRGSSRAREGELRRSPKPHAWLGTGLAGLRAGTSQDLPHRTPAPLPLTATAPSSNDRPFSLQMDARAQEARRRSRHRAGGDLARRPAWVQCPQHPPRGPRTGVQGARLLGQGWETGTSRALARLQEERVGNVHALCPGPGSQGRVPATRPGAACPRRWPGRCGRLSGEEGVSPAGGAVGRLHQGHSTARVSVRNTPPAKSRRALV